MDNGNSDENGRRLKVKEDESLPKLDDKPGFLVSVDFSIEKPIYLQVVENIISLIAAGDLRTGTRLPSSRRLSTLLGVNYHTINKAYEILIRQGILAMDRRKRVEVRKIAQVALERPDAAWINRQKSLIEEAISKGILKDTILLAIRDIVERIPGRDEGK
jgi:DNA-binding transcriptional regulator YhcF (GntR family)